MSMLALVKRTTHEEGSVNAFPREAEATQKKVSANGFLRKAFLLTEKEVQMLSLVKQRSTHEKLSFGECEAVEGLDLEFWTAA